MNLSKISTGLYELWRKHSNIIAAVLIIVAAISAFWLRAQQYFNVVESGIGVVHPEAKLDELDPFVNYWIVNYIDKHGFLSFFNLTEKNSATCLFWYPECRNLYGSELPGHLLTIYFLYQIIKPLNIQLYDLMAFIPPFLGALSVIFIALAVKELTESNITSIVSAFVYAFMFISREVAGFTVKYSFGLFTAPLAIWLHMRMLKKPSIKNSVAAGLALAYAASVWTGVGLTSIPVYLSLILAPLFLNLSDINNFKKYTSIFATEIFIPVLAMISMPVYRGGRMILMIGFIISFAFYILGAFLQLFLSKNKLVATHKKTIARKSSNLAVKIYLAIILILIITGATLVVMMAAVPGFLERFTKVIPLAGKILLGLGINPGGVAATVAQYQPGYVQASEWYMVINLLLLIFILAPLVLYDVFRKKSFISLVIATWSFFSWYATYNTSYFSDYTKLSSAITIGYALGVLIVISKPRILSIGKIVKLKLDFTNIMAIIIAVSITTNSIYLAYDSSWIYGRKYTMLAMAEGFYQPTDVWISALDFIRRNTSKDSLVVSWWDYGYWLSVIGNRSTLADGATINSEKIQNLARFFTGAYNETYKNLKNFGACNKKEVYVVIFSPVDISVDLETRKLFIAFSAYPAGFGDIPKFISAIIYLATGREAYTNLTHATSLHQFNIDNNEWILRSTIQTELGQLVVSFVSLNINSEKAMNATLPRLFMWAVSKTLKKMYPVFEQVIVPTIIGADSEGRIVLFTNPQIFGYSLDPVKLEQNIYDTAYVAISQPIELSNNVYRYVFVTVLKLREEVLNIICT